MSFIGANVEMARMGPEILGFQADGFGDTLRIGGAVLTASGTLLYSLFRAFKQVPEGFVGIRTFNGRALDRNGEPLHPLLEPGGHWMLPFIHDVEMVNRQHQTTLIETTVDVTRRDGFQQYRLGAVATWGVLSDRTKSIRPVVSFRDAYNQFYGIDSFEDLEVLVAGTTTRYLVDCALELEPEDRTIDVLNDYATANLIEGIQGLDPYGVGVHGVQITEFSHSGVIQIGTTD